jgi:hypothetical protein
MILFADGIRLAIGVGFRFIVFRIRDTTQREFKHSYRGELSSKQYVVMTQCTLQDKRSVTLSRLRYYYARQICPFANRDIKSRTRECLVKVNREIRSDSGNKQSRAGQLPKRTDLFCMSVIAIIGASRISIAGIYITQPNSNQKRSVIVLANKSCTCSRLDLRGESSTQARDR